MEKYSLLNLLRHACSGNTAWSQAWRHPEPKPAYDVLIIGGGGHGLATAHYLAKEHGIRDVAVLEKSWIGGGNTGRNTTIVRSDYLLEENSQFYEFSLGLWETLSNDLNFNVMLSQRGALNLAHSEADLASMAKLGNALRIAGIDAELMTREEVQKFVPLLDCSDDTRYPVHGALLQGRGGTARHDAVAWGYARSADSYGVDIIQNCEVTGMQIEKGRIRGVKTNRGTIRADKVAIEVAGHSSQVATLAGLRLPIESHLLQAMVTEPIKPALDTVVMGHAFDGYVSQTDKGEIVMGAQLDYYPSYSQRGNLPRIEDIARYTCTMFPSFSRLRMMRSWAGINDMTMDGSPIMGPTPIDGLYINGGWCYGGFKATPASGWTFAHTLAHEQVHPLIEPFNLDRFMSGKTIDETGTGPFPQRH